MFRLINQLGYMLGRSSALEIFIGFMIPTLIVLFLGLKLWKTLCPKKLGLKRWAVAAAILAAIYVGGTKPDQPAGRRVAQLVMVMNDGTVVDPSSVLGRAVQIAAIEAFNEETAIIISNANMIVAAALDDYAMLTNQIAHADYSVAYLGYDFPRANPPETTNHNITATIERVSAPGGETLSTWVYFSSQPETNVNLHLQASLAQDTWVDLEPVTNTWPVTEAVGALACIRYDYSIPNGMIGVPLRPHYDVLFGGPGEGQYLNVPDTGVIVSVGETDYAPFTGCDATNAAPFEMLAVEYLGGIAIKATAYGTNYAGVITERVEL